MKTKPVSAALLAALAWFSSCRADANTLMTAPPAVTRDDGSKIEWYLDRQGAPGRQGILVLAQGSGCASATVNPNLVAARKIAPGFAVLMVDKYAVHAGDPGAGGHDRGCSPTFYAHHTVSLRADDYVRAIKAAESLPWWNGRLVLFGGSEGGAVMQIIAKTVHPDAAVIFSSATGIPFGQAFLKVLPPPLLAESKTQVAYARAHPDSAEVWAGNSYKWWADIVDRPLWREAQAADLPILVVQGAHDRSNPMQSARAFRDAFIAAHGCRLSYWEYADFDHQMADASGQSHLVEVLGRIAQWVAAREEKAPQSDCVDR